MLQSNPTSDQEVAVVGAGPYGLSVAAHLKSRGIRTRVFGEPMSFWQQHMPKGMRLRSSLTASDLSDPAAALDLQAYANAHGITLAYPVPIETFIAYGRWFQAETTPELDGRQITRVEAQGGRFTLRLSDGDRLTVERVVMATGLARHEHRPAEFAGLPRDLVSHSCEHSDLTIFRGRRVAVIGRGQSACESAALLNLAGAEVDLLARGDVRWLGLESPTAEERKALVWRLRALTETKSGVGPFPFNWPAEFPDLVRRLPPRARARFSARCLRAGAAGWLKPHFPGVRLAAGRQLRGARAVGSQVSLQFADGAEMFDHVLLATGYRVDLARLEMLDAALLQRIHLSNGSPVLATGFESSVPGLHFVGASSVHTYGPLMRFVAGAGYAARHLTRTVSSARARSRPFTVRRAPNPVLAQRQ